MKIRIMLDILDGGMKTRLTQFCICQDKHWEECIPKEIPYTIAAEKYKKKEFEGSAQVKSPL